VNAIKDNNELKEKPVMKQQLDRNLFGQDSPSEIDISWAEDTSFDVNIHPGSLEKPPRVLVCLPTLSAWGEAANPTSAEVAQQNHLEAPSCERLIPREQQTGCASGGSVWSDGSKTHRGDENARAVLALPVEATRLENKNKKTMTHNTPIIGQVKCLQNINGLNATASASSPRRSQAAGLASTLSALLLLATPVLADPFFFSTGAPDGKIGTLSRPASPGAIQTETADDFVLKTNTVINQASFTGLLPFGASLASIRQVEIEIYHVFGKDSVNPPSGHVPTRVNSPADVEIGSATRDSLNGSLEYEAKLVSPKFTVANSVVAGIHPIPNQKTTGEGPVTGEEVTIFVVFNPPISLPGDHYFFRPEVLLSSGDFLWLSAPKPITAPGTPFTPDLQSWIRNDNLAPDWLRIGTDITGQGPFNAAFALSGETDLDGDGVPDSLDLCPNTPAGAIVDAHGCSLDQLVPCSGPASGGVWRNHGAYVSSFVHATVEFAEDGLITAEDAEALVTAAAQSGCGAGKR
jgi:hypothetical protein